MHFFLDVRRTNHVLFGAVGRVASAFMAYFFHVQLTLKQKLHTTYNKKKISNLCLTSQVCANHHNLTIEAGEGGSL